MVQQGTTAHDSGDPAVVSDEVDEVVTLQWERHTQWAVEVTWPDGTKEHRTRGLAIGTRPYSRRDAEVAAQFINTDRLEGLTRATAGVASRPIIVGAWTGVSDEG